MIHNKFGRYWNTTRYTVPAVTDLKARVGKFTTPWATPLDPLFTLPELKVIPDSLGDIMDERAIELNEIAKATNRKIMIMWSGGIDSTGVLVSFLKNLSKQDLENVHVVLSADSVCENPSFYEKYIHNKLTCVPYLKYYLDNHTLDTCINLNGDPADALFGPSYSMYKSYVPDGGHLKPFRFNTKLISEPIEKYGEYYNKKFSTQGIGTWYVQKISKNIFDAQPDGVESIADWWWWHYINFKWEFSIWRSLLRRKTGPSDCEPISRNRLEFFVKNTFYNTDRFQQWSYSNLKAHIINNDITTHKRQIKEYIVEFDGNRSYQEQKTKVTSVPIYDHSLYYQVRKPFLIGEDWVGYYDNEHPGLVEECRVRLETYRG
jgi:hypothetical protein